MQDLLVFYPLSGYEGYYEINKIGDIRSIKRIHLLDSGGSLSVGGNYLKPKLSNRGYFRVSLNISELGIRNIKVSVHRLVAMTFIPNKDNLNIVNHIDSNPLNNNVSNLEWCTQSHNIIHKYKMGFINKNRSLSDSQVMDIYFNVIKSNNSNTGTNGVKGNVSFYCKKHNTTRTVISGIINNKTYINVTSKFNNIINANTKVNS